MADEPPAEPTQLSLFEATTNGALPAAAPVLPALEPIPVPPLYDVRSLSYSAISLFDRCSYRFFAERVARLPGGPRKHAQAMESLRICAAFRAAQAPAVARFFSDAHAAR